MATSVTVIIPHRHPPPDQTSENMHAEEVRDMEIDAAAATPRLATKAVFASQTILFWDD